MFKLFFIFLALFSFLSARDENSNYVKIISENDALGIFTDQLYTSGNRIEFSSPNLPSLQRYIFNGLWEKNIRENCEKFTNKCIKLQSDTYSINQLIYTPHNTYIKEVDERDRAFAGILYFGNAYHAVYNHFIFNSEIKLGTTGPNSAAEVSQKSIHQFFSFVQPIGWGHQIREQKLINYDTRFIFPLSKQIAFHSGAGLGNMDTNINLGFYFRFGKISSKDTFSGMSIKDFGSSGVYNGYPQNSENLEYYFFIYPYLRAQYWDISVHGMHPDRFQNQFDTRGILDNPDISERDRFLMFKFGVLNTNERDGIEEIILFNSYFNNFNQFTTEQFNFLLQYISNSEKIIEPELLYLIIYNINRPDGGERFALSKAIALKNILEESVIPQSQHDSIFLMAFLNGEFDDKREKISILKNYQGSLQTGMIINSDFIFASFSFTITTLDFHANAAIPPYHMWGTVQGGIRF